MEGLKMQAIYNVQAELFESLYNSAFLTEVGLYHESETDFGPRPVTVFEAENGDVVLLEKNEPKNTATLHLFFWFDRGDVVEYLRQRSQYDPKCLEIANKLISPATGRR